MERETLVPKRPMTLPANSGNMEREALVPKRPVTVPANSGNITGAGKRAAFISAIKNSEISDKARDWLTTFSRERGITPHKLAIEILEAAPHGGGDLLASSLEAEAEKLRALQNAKIAPPIPMLGDVPAEGLD